MAEYVYGPDYVDEFILQTRKLTGGGFQTMYMLQDANYNVVALTNDTGGVLEQYAWEPYGTRAAIDTIGTPAPDNRVGHQGLFYYSFGIDGLYYNRNRWYSPTLGRFTTKDPNEAGQLVVGALAMNGGAMDALLNGFGAGGHYRDGMNLYAYLGSNPLGVDPLGLYDPFEAADEIIYALTGGRAAAAHHAFAQIGRLAQKTATFAIQATLSAIFPPYGLYLSVQGAATAMEDMMFNGVTAENSAMLGLSILGGRASFGPAVNQLQGMAAGIGRGYRAVGRRYAQMGMSKSGFNAGDGATNVRNPLVKLKSFSIRDWTGYPTGVPKPSGPFVLLEGAEYQAARRLANNANRSLHRQHPEWGSNPIHEIHPVKFGGSPTDPANKIVLDPSVHHKVSAFWKRLQTELEKGG